MIIDCISDLHGHYPKLKGGDLLIVAGDLTATHTEQEFDEFDDWFDIQKYRKKIFIAGNHDTLLVKDKPKVYRKGFNDDLHEKFEYLCDSGTEFEGMKIWGSPWTLEFPDMNPDCMAFTVRTESELKAKWDLIPKDIDILITHSPPWGVLDKNLFGNHVGSASLYGWLQYVGRPLLHVCGHIHEAYGKMTEWPEKSSKITQSVNASLVDFNYKPINKPIRVLL